MSREQQAALAIRQALPAGGIFANQDWRIAPAPFRLGKELARELESLGRVLLQFYRAVNLLYRQSAAGRQPAWVAALLDQGKPADLIGCQRAPQFKNDLPRVIRPDILLTDEGFSITELDSVPGGIGLTAWLNQTYAPWTGGAGNEAAHPVAGPASQAADPSATEPPARLLGTANSMIEGFADIFEQATRVHIVVSEEAATYRPEMQWLAAQAGDGRFRVQSADFTDIQPGDAVYRFFELFDLANVQAAARIFDLARAGQIQVTPPPKPVFEEKILLALLWNRNLREFWRRELGQAFFQRLLRHVPYTWILDPAPLPPQGAIPELNLTDWQQLKELSQRERHLVLKISGFSEKAWGARGVFLGSDLSRQDWSAAVDQAIAAFGHSPYVLQRYQKPRTVQTSYFDFTNAALVPMPGRVRLCPYYFVSGAADAASARLGGVLATICPADKKIIHGMSEAVLVPCAE
jgi:hypothetical protein